MVDMLFEHVELDPKARFVNAFAEQGYTTNIPLPDPINGRAFVAYGYDDKPLVPEHGGPASGRTAPPSLEDRQVGTRFAPR